MGNGSEKRDVAVWTTIVVGTALSLWACTHGNSPTAPTAGDARQAGVPGDGGRSVTTVGPSGVPVGPSGVPVGPGGVPIGPSARPIGPGPLPPPGGGGGGGGGGGTPAPTPTPTPTTLPCPSAFTFEITTPRPMANLVIPIPTGNYGLDCVVDKAIVSIHAKTGGGNINAEGEVFASLDACGGGPGFSGCGGAVIYRFNFIEPSGSRLGTSCYDLILDDGAAAKFDPPINTPPPYSGIWRWPETMFDEWYLRSSFEFRNVDGPSDYELQCLKVVFVTKTVPLP